MPGIHFKLRRGYKLHEQQSWDVFLGERCEGSITWHRAATDIGHGEIVSPGYHWTAWHETGQSGPFPTLKQALRDMESYFSEVLLNA